MSPRETGAVPCALPPKAEVRVSGAINTQQEGRGTRLADYWPLISLLVGALLAALAIAAGAGEVEMRPVIHAYMGVFLFVFALLKIFDLEGFKDGFATYDLLARRDSRWG